MQTPLLPLPDLYAAANSSSATAATPAPEEAKRLRIENHLPAASVAAAVGASESSLLRWESGRAKPRGFAAVKYGRVLKLLAEAVSD